MPIISFLLEHWIIVVIVYFVFSSIFKRMKPGNSPGPQSPGKPASGMPPFGGGGSGWPTGQDARPMRKAASARPQTASVKREPARGSESKPGVIRDPEILQGASEVVQAAPAVQQKPGLGERARSEAEIAAPEPPAARGALRPEDAALGVLLAEILGPPRAKRPYRR